MMRATLLILLTYICWLPAATAHASTGQAATAADGQDEPAAVSSLNDLEWESGLVDSDVDQRSGLQLIGYRNLPLIVYERMLGGKREQICLAYPGGVRFSISDIEIKVPQPGFAAPEFSQIELDQMTWSGGVVVDKQSDLGYPAPNDLAAALNDQLLDIAYVDYHEGNSALQLVRVPLAEAEMVMAAPPLACSTSLIRILGTGWRGAKPAVVYFERRRDMLPPLPETEVTHPFGVEDLRMAVALVSWPQSDYQWQYTCVGSGFPRDDMMCAKAFLFGGLTALLMIPDGQENLLYAWSWGDSPNWDYDFSLPAPDLSQAGLLAAVVDGTWGIAYQNHETKRPYYYYFQADKNGELQSSEYEIARAGLPVALADYGGRPLVLLSSTTDSGHISHHAAWAMTAQPQSADDWEIVNLGNSLWTYSCPAALAIIDGLPAVAYIEGHELKYLRAHLAASDTAD